ncbi:FMN-binding protein [Schaalia sp. ZJ1691]|uniref:FMN-binding protein n=1 Tax=Schaalia sp. ZJ1691 TaxID=2709404 RepID=UPI001F1504A9|nr:FMN-binding protein [Schaalia sp. ZJ1691]
MSQRGSMMGLTAMILAACSTQPTIDMSIPMRDGEWTGLSNPDEQGAVGALTITVKDGKITRSEYQTEESDGHLKDSDYGKDSSGKVFNKDYYDRAQKAVESFAQYSQKLTETGDLTQVDVISGATVAHSQFVQAAIRAISAAQGVNNDASADKIDIPGLNTGTESTDPTLDEDLGGSTN